LLNHKRKDSNSRSTAMVFRIPVALSGFQEMRYPA
jgi:hypothetical protein